MNNLCKRALENGGSINYLIIPSNLTEGLGLTNPSILFIDGSFLLNLRHVQYTLYHSEGNQKFQSLWGPLAYLNPEDDITLRTTNYLCQLDSNTLAIDKAVKVNTSELDIEPLWEFIGLEDARIVDWNKHIYLTGVRRDTKPDGEGRMELSLITKGAKEIKRSRIEPPVKAYCEKNWMPILDMPFHYVKWTSPTEVVKVDPKKGTSKTVNLVEQTITFPKDIRGGSQVITVGDYRIALTHEVDLWFNEQGKKDAQYYHRFIVWDKDWKIVAKSEDFKFMTANIEFSCGLAFDGNDFIIPFGFQDSTAFILKLPIHTFESITDFNLGLKIKHESKGVTPSKLESFILDPYNSDKNFDLGEFYFNQGHTASALAFYLRSAEYSKNDDLTYESLLMVAKCLSIQGRRGTTEKGLWLNAVTFAPQRPEAYLFLSELAEGKQQYHESYSYAIMGLTNKENAKEITPNVGYENSYQLQFQKAVTCWWVGQDKLSREIFSDLALNSKGVLSEKYKKLIHDNLTFLFGVKSKKNEEVVYYKFGEDPIELNNTGYLLNDLQLAQGLADNDMFTFEIDFIHKVIENYSDLTKDFIDIGAHVGTYSWLTAPHFNHVHSFEPNKKIYNYLCGNIALRGLSDEIDTYLLGISDKEDNLKYYERSKDGGGNGFENIETKEKTIQKSFLPVKTLDSFNFDNVGFIKIDVEGHEKSVLLGAKQTLKNNNYPPILFESWAPGEHSEHNLEYIINLRKELFKVIENYGYSIHEWSSEIFLAVKEQQKPTQITMGGNINNKQ